MPAPKVLLFLLFLVGAFLVLVTLAPRLTGKSISGKSTSAYPGENLSGNYNIYVVYSDQCPHCRHLLEFLSSLGANVHLIRVEDFAKLSIYHNLSRYFTGVPFVFAKVNGSLVIIEGFPDASQDVDGYFYGRDYEMKLCKQMNGEPVFVNGTYWFCRLDSIRVLGNEHAIVWFLEQCRLRGCQPLR